MAYENELSGALFKNDKGGNANRPDYRGTCVIEGKQYRISSWVRKARSTGKAYMSLAFTLDTEQPTPTAEVPVEAADFEQPTLAADDDIPF